jgi:hypothetical protein
VRGFLRIIASGFVRFSNIAATSAHVAGPPPRFDFSNIATRRWFVCRVARGIFAVYEEIFPRLSRR